MKNKENQEDISIINMIRRSRKLTLKDIGDILGTTYQAVGNMERRKTESLEHLALLQKNLKINIKKLWSIVLRKYT